MPATNAGIKRNRLPAGVKPSTPDVTLAPTTYQAYREAARASGNLSFSLYLERLAHELKELHGSLPVLSPPLVDVEVSATRGT